MKGIVLRVLQTRLNIGRGVVNSVLVPSMQFAERAAPYALRHFDLLHHELSKALVQIHFGDNERRAHTCLPSREDDHLSQQKPIC